MFCVFHYMCVFAYLIQPKLEQCIVTILLLKKLVFILVWKVNSVKNHGEFINLGSGFMEVIGGSYYGRALR